MVSNRPIAEVSAAPDYIVTGFYTPDYAPLARKFMDNLSTLGVPHHLYQMPKSSWNRAILLKPTIVERAMADFPGKTIILMDIDCVLGATIEPVARSAGDVSLYVGVRFSRTRKRSLQLRVLPSSRVIMWKPTAAAKALVANWRELCAAYEPNAVKRDDEELLMQAIGITEGLALGIIDKRYSGRDPIDAPDDALVIHYSAHDASRIANEPRRYLKHLKRSVIGWIVGKPYKEWKYGIKDSRSLYPRQMQETAQ